jgi:hypothetical protein
VADKVIPVARRIEPVAGRVIPAAGGAVIVTVTAVASVFLELMEVHVVCGCVITRPCKDVQSSPPHGASKVTATSKLRLLFCYNGLVLNLDCIAFSGLMFPAVY